MTDDAIEALGFEMSAYIIQLNRAPTRTEIVNFIRSFIRARKNGKLMS